jgi:hypothetical protein
MYATIRNYAGGGALADALVEHQAAVRDLISGVDGFRAYYVIRDPDGATTVSIFDDRAGAEESTRVAAAWVAENLGELGLAPPQVVTGEVLLSV